MKKDKDAQNIVFLINRLYTGGAERQVVDDINEMVRRQIPVKLITFFKEKEQSLKDQLNLSESDCYLIEFENLFDIGSYKKLRRLLIELNPKVVISHLWFSNTIARVMALFANLPKLITFEQNIYDSVKSWKQFVCDYILQDLSTHIVAVSEAVKRSLLRHSIRYSKVKVIFNSIDVNKFKNAEAGNIRSELDIAPNDFVFITIGRLIKQKGMDTLIKSFAKVSQSDVKSHLLIVGEGGLRSTLEKMVESYGDINLSEHIHFLGTRYDIPEILKSVDAFVLASRFEGVGIVVMEAMASGLPIIVTDFEAGQEFLDDQTALISPIDDIRDLSKNMQKVIDDPELAENLSQKALENIENFDIKGHVDRILELIDTKK